MGIEKLHLEDALEDSPQVNYGWILVQTDVEVKWEGCCAGYKQRAFPMRMVPMVSICKVNSEFLHWILTACVFSLWRPQFYATNTIESGKGPGYIRTEVLYRVQCLIYQADLKQIFYLHWINIWILWFENNDTNCQIGHIDYMKWAKFVPHVNINLISINLHCRIGIYIQEFCKVIF